MFWIELGPFGYWFVALDVGGKVFEAEETFPTRAAAENEAERRNRGKIVSQGRLDEKMLTIPAMTWREYFKANPMAGEVKNSALCG
jgi:hypothetical protein